MCCALPHCYCCPSTVHIVTGHFQLHIYSWIRIALFPPGTDVIFIRFVWHWPSSFTLCTLAHPTPPPGAKGATRCISIKLSEKIYQSFLLILWFFSFPESDESDGTSTAQSSDGAGTPSDSGSHSSSRGDSEGRQGSESESEDSGASLSSDGDQWLTVTTVDSAAPPPPPAGEPSLGNRSPGGGGGPSRAGGVLDKGGGGYGLYNNGGLLLCKCCENRSGP